MTLATRAFSLDIAAPPSTGLLVGPAEVLALAAQRPYRFPDGIMGVVPGSWEGNEPFSYFAATTGRGLYRTQGPLSKPTTRYTNLRITPANIPAHLQYCGGGPIWRVSPTLWIMVVHNEVWANAPSHLPFRSSLGLIKSTDEGRTWAWLGEIVKTQQGYALPFSVSQDIGGGPFVLRDGDLWIYFREELTAGGDHWAVAKASQAAVITWAGGGVPAPFLKYANGSFTGNGLTGASSPLPGPSGYSFRDVAWSGTLGRYVMVSPMWEAAPSLPSGIRVNLYLDESLDGLSWGNRRALWPSAGNQDYYATMVGVTGATDDVAGDFYVYYVQSDVQTLLRRRVTFA